MRLLTRMRMDARMTRQDLEDKSGVKVRTIRALESEKGAIRVPSDATLFGLADAFDMDPIELRRAFERDANAEGAVA